MSNQSLTPEQIKEMFDIDEYGEVLNGERTFDNVAMMLKLGIPVFIGWTDHRGSHVDILMQYKSGGFFKLGNIQGGIEYSDLFVSIMRVGAWGFEFNKVYKEPDYVEEKLDMMSILKGETATQLAILINNVMHRLSSDQPKEAPNVTP